MARGTEWTDSGIPAEATNKWGTWRPSRGSWMSYVDWCQRWAHFNPHNTLALFSFFLKEDVCQLLKSQHLGRRLA